MKTAFISGHGDLTTVEFEQYYKPLIDKAIIDGCSFVVGDFKGADSYAQVYLYSKAQDVIVYHMFNCPRFNAGFPSKGGYNSDDERDAAMTANSDFDIAWIRPGKEKSGTEKNIKRRIKL